MGAMVHAGDVEGWAHAYVASRDLADKLRPGPPPGAWAPAPAVLRLASPGRPPELQALERGLGRSAPKVTSAAALRDPRRRAQLLHAFFHHELQAAELMAWALLAFADAAPAFRRGLLHICLDEIRHAGAYAAQVERLGARIGDFPVNDWFWQRVPAAATPAHFVALMGIGLEGGNLDHAARFEARMREAGDLQAAAVSAQVAAEEVPHVAFAAHWFRVFTGGLEFDTWRAHLPSPLSPTVMRGQPMDLAARARAGMSDVFLQRLARW